MSKARLREFARTKWGDEWFLKTIEDADGDEQYCVHHTETLVSDGIVIRDIAVLEDDAVTVTRRLVDTTEFIAEIDTDGT
ncbi:hypothetical protein [Haloarcula pellucida]|uniref:Uncharacterized protein n=1 Tax=Haloarcula pellucida TaxID=1427151 RepID=A0A830GSV8_9EURY|nr:hypothetical protein [Halomicroarcula pellucida]MBX0350489.1 hypothetical protein [Halomicroarcula pellucida]GGO03550.1 hypothetical protein GCM10009030_39340 [Halomicroarcula pellucida]